MPSGQQCPISWSPLPAGEEQREGQGAECPQGKERTSSASQTLCRHSQEPFLSKQTTFRGFSSRTGKQPSSEPQEVRGESSTPLTCHSPGSRLSQGKRGGLGRGVRKSCWQASPSVRSWECLTPRVHFRLAELIPMVCSWRGQLSSHPTPSTGTGSGDEPRGLKLNELHKPEPSPQEAAGDDTKGQQGKADLSTQNTMGRRLWVCGTNIGTLNRALGP